MTKERNETKAIRDSEIFWQLDGESNLTAVLIPENPTHGKSTTIRLTHSNIYGPVDDAVLYVRIGDPKNPTAQDDLKSHTDWIKADLVEELVRVEDEELPRSDANEPFEDETPWYGTFEAQLTFPEGKHSVEIKIISQCPEILRSLVLTGWDIACK